MTREHVCHYGECESTSTFLLVTDRDWPDAVEHMRFCSYEHLAAWSAQAYEMARKRKEIARA